MEARYAHLGRQIQAARRRKKLTQDELARRVGAQGGRFTVIRWEQGVHRPTEFAAGLVSELGLDESLFDDEEDSSFALARDLAAVIDRHLTLKPKGVAA